MRTHCFVLAFVTLALVLPLPRVRAQNEGVAPGRAVYGIPPGMSDMRSELERMQYNTDRGPLLAVVSLSLFRTLRPLPAPDAPGATPLMIADAFDRRIFKAGSVTVIAPRQMTVINTRPGKANLFLNLPPDQRLKALLGTLTTAQWQRAGSDGLGLSDLTDDQKALMESAWPRVTRVQKRKVVVPPDKPASRSYETEGDPFTVDPGQIRLRFSRAATYQFRRQGLPESRPMMDLDHFPQEGEIAYASLEGRSNEGDRQGDDRTAAYGVKIINTVSNQLKPSELDFAASALDGLVPLQSPDGTPLQTLGDLLKQISTVTRLDIRADARLDTLPLYIRAAPGQTVRAGDALMALAYSVTGAYRRLTPRLFLLTNDVEGIGTRFARLNEWVGNAAQERYDLLERIGAEMAKRKPMQYLDFSSGSKPLLDSIAQKVEGSQYKDPYSPGVDFKISDLPARVRKDAEAERETWEQFHTTFSIDRETVNIGMVFKAQWVLPGGGVLEDQSGLENLHPQFIAELIPRVRQAAPAPKAAGKAGPLFPPALTRRVLAISPRTPGEARQLIHAALGHGFTEIWMRQNLDTTDDTVIKAAVAAGKSAQVPVVVMPSLLRRNGIGVPERTILGQTGAEWGAVYIAGPTYVRHPDWKAEAVRDAELYQDWTSPANDKDEAILLKRLVALAQISGIRGLCLTHTTPPGYYDSQGGSGMPTGSEFGYTQEERLRFLDASGYDPVDVVGENWSLQVEKSLPFFPIRFGTRYKVIEGKAVAETPVVPPVQAWQEFRDAQVRTRLGDMYQALRRANPKLPLYLEDRVSEYTTPYTPWFGSWDKADRLPNNQVFVVEYEGDNLARAAANVRLFRTRWDKRTGDPKEADRFLSSLQRGVTRVTSKPGMWQGIAVDLSALSAADALQMLAILPDTPPATH